MNDQSGVAASFLQLLASMDPSIVVLSVMFVVVLCVVWSWHRDRDNDFHLQQILVDNVSHKISAEKVAYMTVLALMSWGFVAYVIKNQLPEWYVYAYGGLFVLGRIASSGISVWKDVSKPKVEEERP